MPIVKRKCKKKVDGDGTPKRSWPLPPSSVFKCREALPWIDPELFRYNDIRDSCSNSNTSTNSRNGIILMGEVISESDEDEYMKSNENESPSSFEYNYAREEEPIYADPVELTGPSDRIIEYSTNPERGIDVGESSSTEEPTKQTLIKENPLLRISGDSSQGQNLLLNLMEKEGYGELEKIMNGMNEAKHKRKKWSPFQKSQQQNWKLFY